MKKNIIAFIICLCGCNFTVDNIDPSPENNIDASAFSPVELVLNSGNLNANMQFNHIEMPLQVSTSISFKTVQVGAFILNLENYNPNFLRVEFTSDRVEWVGTTGSELNIYDSLLHCTESSEYCESITVGEGKSGYFEIQNGQIAIQNAYCRFNDESYSYTITATAHDLSAWPYLQISDPTEIEISCRIVED